LRPGFIGTGASKNKNYRRSANGTTTKETKTTETMKAIQRNSISK